MFQARRFTFKPSLLQHVLHQAKPCPMSSIRMKHSYSVIMMDDRKGSASLTFQQMRTHSHSSFSSPSEFQIQGKGHSHSHSHGHSHSDENPMLLMEEQQGEGARITLIGVVANVGLSIVKGIAGVFWNSSALIADAAHSLSDLFSDFVTYMTIKISRTPPDEKHPYGYGKFEPLGGLTISGLLVATAGGIGYHSYGHISEIISAQSHNLPVETISFGALGIILGAIVIKEVLYRKTLEVGRKTRSQVLLANAWHHRSDALSSGVTLLGVMGSIGGYPICDPAAGAVVSIMVLKAAYDVGRKCVQDLTDTNSYGIVDDVKSLLQPLQNPTGEIQNIHDVRARDMGPYILLDLHMRVNPLLSVSGAYQAGQRVRSTIIDQFPEIQEVLIHFDVDDDSLPKPLKQPKTPQEITSDVKDILKDIPEILGVSHVVVHYLKNRILVEVQIIVDSFATVKEAQTIANMAKKTIEQLKGVDEAHVDLELATEHQWSSLENPTG